MRVSLKSWVMSGCAGFALALTGCGAPAGQIELSVLSSRADLVSGGDALVEVRGVGGAALGEVSATLDGQPLQVSFAPAGENVLRGKVTGLKNGANALVVEDAGGRSAKIELVNHAITGPILSGPHMTPFECRTVESGLGEPTDADCSAPTRHDWFYRNADGAFLALENRAELPADVAMTTTIDGKTVPYVVRVESGVINRGIYRLAVLDDPATEGFSAEEGWNGRLGVTFGGGCGTNYNQGDNQVTSILSDLYLSRGFAYMNSTELVNGLHCNQVLQGETLMMLKENFIENYGVPKWTVGTGGSGGAIQQLGITQIYPGLLDGLQPSVAFPDSTLHTADCGLLQTFWRSGDGAGWTSEQQQAVAGFYGTTCASWERSFVPTMIADTGCGLNDESLVYDPKANPKGARCTVNDMRANLYGRDAQTGFGLKVQDNVGLQYGLGALNDGAISVDQFLTLNAKIGGTDNDGFYVAARSQGNADGIAAAYKSGALNSGGGGLRNVPIILYRGYSDTINDIHSRERDLVIRARLEQANGRSDNTAIWISGGRGASGGVNLAALVLDAMTEWLDAMAADTAPLSPDKVAANKPASVVDAFWTGEGVKTPGVMDWDLSSPVNQLYPIHKSPRLVAGAPIANNILKCQLKPVDDADYKVAFSDDQKARLRDAFPDGVCDWSKPGVGQGPISGTYVKY